MKYPLSRGRQSRITLATAAAVYFIRGHLSAADAVMKHVTSTTTSNCHKRGND